MLLAGLDITPPSPRGRPRSVGLLLRCVPLHSLASIGQGHTSVLAIPMPPADVARRRRNLLAPPRTAAGATATSNAARRSLHSSTPTKPPAPAATNRSTPARNGISTTTTPATATSACPTRPATSGPPPRSPTVAEIQPGSRSDPTSGANAGTTTRPLAPSSTATSASSTSGTANGSRSRITIHTHPRAARDSCCNQAHRCVQAASR